MSHYDAGGIQPLEFMKAKMTPAQYQGFLLGNVIKYTGRCNQKGCFLEDLEKAKTYLDTLIQEIKNG